MKSAGQAKACPFCGMEVDFTNGDTLYPSGTGWNYNAQLELRTYHRRSEVPEAQWCWTMHCPTTAGGCGAQMPGDSREEALASWNNRNVHSNAQTLKDRSMEKIGLLLYIIGTLFFLGGSLVMWFK